MPILPQRTDPSRKATKTCAVASILLLRKSTRRPESRRIHQSRLVHQINDLSYRGQAPFARIFRAGPSSRRILPSLRGRRLLP